MNKLKMITLAACLILSVSLISTAEAFFVVDTGTPTGVSSPLDLSTNQWLAAEFTLLENYTITSLEGWMKAVNGTVTAVLYGDGGAVPDVGDEIFSQQFSVTNGGGYDWFGATGLNLDLAPGTYWLAFEVRDGLDLYDGSMQRESPNPLIEEAFFRRDTNDEYLSKNDFNTQFDLGVRVGVVPEPMTMVTLGFSLLGGAALRRKKFTV